jgi:hypothetical protein
MQNIKIDIICNKMDPLEGTWYWNQIYPENRPDNTHIKIEFSPISSTFLANDANFAITLKFKLET